MRYVKNNNTKIDDAHLTVFKLMDKLLEELTEWNIIVDALIIDAKNIITKYNFIYQDIIVENKKKLFEKVTLCEKTFRDRFIDDSQSFFIVINKKVH